MTNCFLEEHIWESRHKNTWICADRHTRWLNTRLFEKIHPWWCFSCEIMEAISLYCPGSWIESPVDIPLIVKEALPQVFKRKKQTRWHHTKSMSHHERLLFQRASGRETASYNSKSLIHHFLKAGNHFYFILFTLFIHYQIEFWWLQHLQRSHRDFANLRNSRFIWLEYYFQKSII